jgi:hypothetical protein
VGSASEYHDVFYDIDVASGRVTEVGPIGADEGDGPRYVRPDGTQLEICRLGGRDCRFADPHDGATVTVRDPDGGLTVRYRDELLPDRAIDASFSADGSTIWLLLERGDCESHPVLGRVDANGSAEVVRSLVDEAVAWWRPVQSSILGLAPDDSFMVIGETENGSAWSAFVTPTAAGGSAATAHGGALAGFLPSAVVDTLTDDPYRQPPAGDPQGLGPASAPTPFPTASPASTTTCP